MRIRDLLHIIEKDKQKRCAIQTLENLTFKETPLGLCTNEEFLAELNSKRMEYLHWLEEEVDKK